MIDGLAALIPAKRSAEDIFAGRIRVDLGGTTYTMPVRSRKANREWLEALKAETGGALDALEMLDDTEQVLRLMFSMTDEFLDALVSYDETNILPSRGEIDEQATDVEVICAAIGVWRAANPLLDIALGLAPAGTPWPVSMPIAPATTAGRRARLRKS